MHRPKSTRVLRDLEPSTAEMGKVKGGAIAGFLKIEGNAGEGHAGPIEILGSQGGVDKSSPMLFQG